MDPLGEPLRVAENRKKEDVTRTVFKNTSGNLTVQIDHLPCAEPRCVTATNAAFNRQNRQLTNAHGQFLAISETDITSAWKTKRDQHLSYLARVPDAVVLWTLRARGNRSLDPDAQFEAIRQVLDRQRYELASARGYIIVGRWTDQIHRHARDLLARGDGRQAARVLREVIFSAPGDYDAHMDFAEATTDRDAARASAQLAWDHAEDQTLRRRAASVLDLDALDPSSLPELARDRRGLQLTLLALPPCDIHLVQDAAEVFARHFDIPVSVVRFPSAWDWDQPERIYREADLQTAILEKSPIPVDFTDWDFERYADKLESLYGRGNAIGQYQVQALLDQTRDGPGQYRAGPRVQQLLRILEPYWSGNRRAMTVAVTGADIFDGDYRYLFSNGWGRDDGFGVSILSYARMQAELTGEADPSRRPVIERLAKEMVPPALQKLGIPRPVDPTDPYSYSSGLERVDQKTLNLSAPTREALDRFRD